MILNNLKYLILCVFVLITVSGCQSIKQKIDVSEVYTKEYIISSEPGKYSRYDVGSVSENSNLSAKLKIINYTEEVKWPSSSYVGFYGEGGAKNSFQSIIIKNHPSDDFLVAGYRLLENGEVVKWNPLKQFSLSSEVNIKLSIAHGIVTIEIEGEFPIVIQTKLKRVTPYVSAASCKSTIKIST